MEKKHFEAYVVNLDMIGNRVAALTFGPRTVIVMVGRNKIVPDLAAAMDRIKGFAAPANAIRLDKKAPCAATGRCQDCHAPDRIYNNWTITEKSFPNRRIKVILINRDLGLQRARFHFQKASHGQNQKCPGTKPVPQDAGESTSGP